MNARDIAVMCLIGIVAGWLASMIVGGSGLLRYLITGLVGSFAGGFLFKQFGISLGIRNELVREIVVATIGAIFVVIAARLIA